MNRPLLLDLFCKAGGAAVGYHRAGFDVIGIDIEPQPNYPYEFIQGDAFDQSLWPDHIDALHASPPCQDHTSLKMPHNGRTHGTGWMLAACIDMFRASGVPWVVENVVSATSRAAMSGAVTLCGSSFGLGVRRHRLFLCSFVVLTPDCRHAQQGTPLGVYGNGGGGQMTRGIKATPAQARIAMGIDWMTHREIAQAIPPAYTEHIGRQLLAHVRVGVAS
jgi:DNA (cytosine-5)-methyltransferase 1